MSRQFNRIVAALLVPCLVAGALLPAGAALAVQLLDDVLFRLRDQIVIQDYVLRSGEQLTRPLAVGQQAEIFSSHPEARLMFVVTVKAGGHVEVQHVEKTGAPHTPYRAPLLMTFRIGNTIPLGQPIEFSLRSDSFTGTPQCVIRVEPGADNYQLIISDQHSPHGTVIRVPEPVLIDEDIVQHNLHRILTLEEASLSSTSTYLIADSQGRITAVEHEDQAGSRGKTLTPRKLPQGWRKIRIYIKNSSASFYNPGSIERPLFNGNAFVSLEYVPSWGLHPNIKRAINLANGVSRELGYTPRDYTATHTLRVAA